MTGNIVQVVPVSNNLPGMVVVMRSVVITRPRILRLIGGAVCGIPGVDPSAITSVAKSRVSKARPVAVANADAQSASVATTVTAAVYATSIAASINAATVTTALCTGLLR